MKRSKEGRIVSTPRGETVRKLMRARRERRERDSLRIPDRLDVVADVLSDRKPATQATGGRA